MFLWIIIAGSLLICNFVTYFNSWDIVKFGSIAQLGLTVSSLLCLNRLFLIKPILSFCALILMTIQSLLFSIGFFVEQKHGYAYHTALRMNESFFINSEQLSIIRFLRKNVHGQDIVFSNLIDSRKYSVLAGLSRCSDV